MGAQGIEATGDNTPTGETLGGILRSAMKDLAQQNREAHDILQSLAEQGSLEEHQTSSALDGIADRLLNTMRSGQGRDAD